MYDLRRFLMLYRLPGEALEWILWGTVRKAPSWAIPESDASRALWEEFKSGKILREGGRLARNAHRNAEEKNADRRLMSGKKLKDAY